LEALRAQSETNADESTAPADLASDRMIVGIYELESATWFFKILGPIQQVTKSEGEWKPFLQGVTFENGEPQWELPPGWKTAEDKPMRFATLEIGDFNPPLELAISSLSANQDRLLNTNRWRGQLGLAALDAARLDENLNRLDSLENNLMLFDATGKSSGDMLPPFAGAGSTNRQPGLPESAVSSRRDSEVRFDTPDGWEKGRTSGMVPVRLQRNSGEKTAQITVITLPAAANEWEPNAKRWASEIGLSALTTDELTKLTSPIEVDGSNGKLLNLLDVQTGSGNATIAGMVKRNGTAWFLKLTGDKELVTESEAAFRAFLGTLKFPGN
jgi:hypothetical protein